jgi:quercetin dioxygenase-like cupin family protein
VKWWTVSIEFVLIKRKKAFMNEPLQTPAKLPPPLRVAAGEDRFGEHRGLGVSAIQFKVTPQDSNGILIIENTFREKGGPARHLHVDQDEWFYAMEGEFIVEVGQERIRLNPGDSLLAPRQIPHVWAFVGDTRGRMLIAFMPAGKMEAFFQEVTKANAMPPQDPELWRAHGMELLGPPLTVS